jgi:hypothetical protein
MASKIFKLKDKGQVHAEKAQRLFVFLSGMGFDAQSLEDLMYQVAEDHANLFREELGPSTAQRMASVEFMAADEISGHSMIDQLIVLREHHGSDEQWLRKLSEALKIDIAVESLQEASMQTTGVGA